MNDDLTTDDGQIKQNQRRKVCTLLFFSFTHLGLQLLMLEFRDFEATQPNPMLFFCKP